MAKKAATDTGAALDPKAERLKALQLTLDKIDKDFGKITHFYPLFAFLLN